MYNTLHAGLTRYLTPEQLKKLRSVRVGIAGAGGLGSNAALMLARSGVEDMLLVDDDVVDASNLNRQQYWPRHVGRPKVEALAELLRELNPEIQLDIRRLRLSSSNLPKIAPLCPIWVEALDDSLSKAMLVEAAILSGARIVAASGLAGYGGPDMHKRPMGDLTLVGDFVTDVQTAPPLAPRVTQAAAMLADTVLEFILGPATPSQS
ncbi:MAG: sulfur carrier protein ThiS adenylyltransferase ThiF [Desulfovibrio sp.]|nr:sulfur carrier protein ThiS adenylyltransferase ThiF [Desulfovibrio sp.]